MKIFYYMVTVKHIEHNETCTVVLGRSFYLSWENTPDTPPQSWNGLSIGGVVHSLVQGMKGCLS